MRYPNVKFFVYIGFNAFFSGVHACVNCADALTN